jgi:hypothetical protein
MKTAIVFCGEPAVVECDGRCAFAWGINWGGGREGFAPEDPGTYEGGEPKPEPPYPPGRHNKWCVRECERSTMRPPGEEDE